MIEQRSLDPEFEVVFKSVGKHSEEGRIKAEFQNTMVKNAGITLLSNGGDMWMKLIIAKGYFQTYGL